jgi:hypothetical protein
LVVLVIDSIMALQHLSSYLGCFQPVEGSEHHHLQRAPAFPSTLMPPSSFI